VQWSAYEGRRMAAKVSAVYLRGALAFEAGQVRNQPGSGRYLRPSPAALKALAQ
jgi:N-acyl-D-aspartate/D-glutamate deacylase